VNLRRVSRAGAILCLHSVTTPGLPASGAAHLRLEALASILRTARLVGELVPLSHLVARHQVGRSTAGLIAVTLDDAYAALGAGFRSLIVREAVPVAVFVVTNAAATGARFWWDRIDDLHPHVPAERWREFEKTCGLTDDYRRGQPREHGPLRPLRQWLLANFAGRWPERLEPALGALEGEAGIRTAHRSMTFAELDALAATGLIEIGVHTVSHPVLPLLSETEVTEEVTSSYDALQRRFAAPLRVLAIPFGLYDEMTLRAARSAGMTASLTLGGRTLHDAARRDALPRFCLTTNDTPTRLALRLLDVVQPFRRWSGHQAVAYPELPSATT